MTSTSSCANESLRSRLTLREEGQVAGLESPNGLGAMSNCQAPKLMSIAIALYFGHLSRWQHFELCNHSHRLSSNEHETHLSINLGGNPAPPTPAASVCARSPATWDIPAGTVLARSKREGWTQQIAQAKLIERPELARELGKARCNQCNHPDAISRPDHAGTRRTARGENGGHYRQGFAAPRRNEAERHPRQRPKSGAI